MNFPMTSKINAKGRLEIGGLDAVELAKKFGTPLFVLDEEHLRSNCRQYTKAFASYPDFKVVYANKALSSTGVLKIIASEGIGMDVASGGELFTALKAGCDRKTIYFHGNSKTREELMFGLKEDIGAFVVDNFDELRELEALSKKARKRARVMFRVNPGIEAHTHDFIKTGTIDSKFGIPKSKVLEAVGMALRSSSLKYVGLHSHIGSQIFDRAPYRAEVEVLMELFSLIKEEYRVESPQMNLGGGIGISYTDREKAPDIGAFVMDTIKTVRKKARSFGLKLPRIVLEPGRSLIGPAVTTLYRVGAVKDIPKIRKYVIVDGGMSDNPRPILYGAKYEALVANKAKSKAEVKVTVAGRACESGDVLIKDIMLPRAEKGDIIAVACTGAYNYSMASNYNRFTRPALVSVRKGRAELLIRRESYKDLVRNDL